jgi:hypothetical protein
MAGKGAGKKGGPKKARLEKGIPKINEFEVWSEFTQSIAKLVSREAERLKGLATNLKPGKASYTFGRFVLDQMDNSRKLLEATLEASRKR